MLIILSLIASFSLSGPAHAQNDLRAFNIAAFSKPYGPEKKQEMQSLGWKVTEKKADGKINWISENYTRRSDGFQQQVQVAYPIAKEQTLYAMPQMPSTVLIGYAPDVISDVGYKEDKIAPFLPINTGYYDLQQPNFSYCEKAPPPPPGMMDNKMGMSCQTVNRDVCDSAMAKRSTQAAGLALNAYHMIYARKQMEMMKQTAQVNRPPSNDWTPSPRLVNACENFYSAYGRNRYPASVAVPQVGRQIPIKISPMGHSEQIQ